MSFFLSSSDHPAKVEAIDPDVTTGHFPHLTPDQLAAFDAFKQSLTNARLYQPPADPDRPRPSHDDTTLLYVSLTLNPLLHIPLIPNHAPAHPFSRFLRARRFDTQKAFKQFADCEAWRKKHNVSALHASFPVAEFESARMYYPRWTGRRDKNGMPVYVYRLAALTPPLIKELNAVSPERRYQRIIVLYETLVGFVYRLCSELPRPIEPTPVCASTSIVDLADASLQLLWQLRSTLQEASALATANYPETLNAICVVNAPAFFPTVWGWIKPWFDEGTRRKIYILGRDPGPALRTLIDPKDLPKAYGGELDWKFEDEPLLDDAAKALIGEMPKGPVLFQDGQVIHPSPPQTNTPAQSTTPKVNGSQA
ncbi:CRAL/TRIO domain-containing protein [Daedaleopsis nitida]|nr:CRAL/TRIO domain-containing protein [Daedaleopsis nitida]